MELFLRLDTRLRLFQVDFSLAGAHCVLLDKKTNKTAYKLRVKMLDCVSNHSLPHFNVYLRRR